MAGRLIVIEGLDGSGKATQAALLLSALAAGGREARALSFPRYGDESSALARMYLRGDFGQSPGDVNAYAASVFFAADRYAGYKKEWQTLYDSGALFVADRYTTSNAIYQAAKLPPDGCDKYLDWLFDFEYNLMGLPRPDAVIYLDMPPEVSRELLLGRYGGDAAKRDIHERDIAFQREGREAALYIAARQGWRVISCADNGRASEPGDIAGAVLSAAREEVDL